MEIVSIVPRLPPKVDGVGDYALQLALQLHQSWGVKTKFIVGDPTYEVVNFKHCFPVEQIKNRSSGSLQKLLKDASIVLLHYVPHGYARKACPSWLITALENWHCSSPGRQLVTMFHELYALDWYRPWSSDFYLSPLQQHLASRVAKLSDTCLTSTERYLQPIRYLSNGKHRQVSTLPVFSNIGELPELVPFSHRVPRLIIFGQQRTKRHIYSKSVALLRQVCVSLSIQEIWDIGPSTGLAPAYLGEVNIIELGKLPNAEISKIFSASLVGILNYPPKRLGQSGVFASFCSHGMATINYRKQAKSIDGLTANLHYWCPETRSNYVPNLANISKNAYRWYEKHTLNKQGEIFYRHLKESSKKSDV